MGLADFVEGVEKSIGRSVVNTGKAVGWAATHPDKVVSGIGYLAEHPGMWGGVAKKMLVDQVTDPVSLITNVAMIAGSGGAALGLEALKGAKVAGEVGEAAKVGKGVAEAGEATKAVAETSKAVEATKGVAETASAAGRTKAFSGGVTSAEETGGLMGKFDRLAEGPSRLKMAGRESLGMSEYGLKGGIKARLAEKIIPNAEGVGSFKEAGTLAPDLEQAGGAARQALYNAVSPSTGTKPLVGGKYAENMWRLGKAGEIANKPSQFSNVTKAAEIGADPEKYVARKAWDATTDPKHWWNQPMGHTQSALQQPGMQQPAGDTMQMTQRDQSEAGYSPGRGFVGTLKAANNSMNFGGNRSFGSGVPWTQQHSEIGGVSMGTDWRNLNRSLSYGTTNLFSMPQGKQKNTPQQPAADSAQVKGGRMSQEDIGAANEGIGKAWGFPKSNTGFKMPGAEVGAANEGIGSSWGFPKSNTGYPMPQSDQDSANAGIAKAWGSSPTTAGGPGSGSADDINSNLSNWRTGQETPSMVGSINRRLSNFQFGQGES